MGLAQQHKMDTGCGVQNIPQVLHRDTMRVIQNQQQVVVPLLQEGVERSQRFNATGTREQYSSQATLLLSRKPGCQLTNQRTGKCRAWKVASIVIRTHLGTVLGGLCCPC
ncbi:Uncharacterised protein [Escherichia coli]|nr:Uncharacterised protein [Escherichia coli]